MSLEIADFAYVLDDGSVVYAGPARELAADEARVQRSPEQALRNGSTADAHAIAMASF